jgi:hypothetical protein
MEQWRDEVRRQREETKEKAQTASATAIAPKTRIGTHRTMSDNSLDWTC